MSKTLLEEIVGSQFEFIKHKAMPEFKNTRLMYFGIFGIKPGRMEHYIHNKMEDKKDES